MGRSKSAPEPTAEDLRLIVLCKEERRRLRNELVKIGPNGRRRIENQPRIEQIRRELKELEDASLAVKFGLSTWTVSRI